MRNLLMVAYVFPPIGGIGAQRTVQFAKYLPQFGWRPVVLTVGTSPDFILDESLADTLPPEVAVYRARSWEPLNAARAKKVADRVETGSSGSSMRQRLIQGLKAVYGALRVPDDKVGWLPHAVSLGKRIVVDEKIDLIYATAPPYTNLLVGRSLARATSLPLVVDYRDEWSTIEYRALPTNFVTRALNRRMERAVLRNADLVISALSSLEPRLRANRLVPLSVPFEYIPNGFDPADYGDSTPESSHSTRKLLIVYTGTFYGERQTPEYFLRGLNEFLKQQPDARTHLDVRFVGSIFGRHAGLIPELGLADVVTVLGVVTHREAIQHQLAADLLLLIIGKGAGSELVLTGKLFEYLGAQRPILALVPPAGAAAELIRSTQTGFVVDATNTGTIAEQLSTLYDDWRNGEIHFAPNEQEVHAYDRRSLTRSLADVLDRVQNASS